MPGGTGRLRPRLQAAARARTRRRTGAGWSIHLRPPARFRRSIATATTAPMTPHSGVTARSMTTTGPGRSSSAPPSPSRPIPTISHSTSPPTSPTNSPSTAIPSVLMAATLRTATPAVVRPKSSPDVAFCSRAVQPGYVPDRPAGGAAAEGRPASQARCGRYDPQPCDESPAPRR